MKPVPDTAELGEADVGATVQLPAPSKKGAVSVEEAILRRRSLRDFASDPVGLAEIAQLLWSAQGLTSRQGLRAAPSAGARYPLETYLACSEGLFRYHLVSHSLIKLQAADLRSDLARAAWGQTFVAQAPVSIIFTAVYERTTSRYGERGIRYVHIDLGHAAQNVHLQAEALGLGSVPVGAFDDDAIAEVLQLPSDQKPLYIIPIGRPARG
jgi:SagB-type dehydrogenase family enzyme